MGSLIYLFFLKKDESLLSREIIPPTRRKHGER
jgi:hypothetical protein